MATRGVPRAARWRRRPARARRRAGRRRPRGSRPTSSWATTRGNGRAKAPPGNAARFADKVAGLPAAVHPAMRTRLLALISRRALPWVLGCGMLLTAPSLFTGIALDDRFVRSLAVGYAPFPRAP